MLLYEPTLVSAQFKARMILPSIRTDIAGLSPIRGIDVCRVPAPHPHAVRSACTQT
jgi:hypothetical protein